MLIEKKIRGGKLGHVEDIVIHRDFREKVIGRSLLNALYEIAKKRDAIKLLLLAKILILTSKRNLTLN